MAFLRKTKKNAFLVFFLKPRRKDFGYLVSPVHKEEKICLP
jgi:hypothetical protein